MKLSSLRDMSEAELSELLIGLSREKFNLKMQKATGQLSKPSQLRRIRKDIARVHTVMSEIQRVTHG